MLKFCTLRKIILGRVCGFCQRLNRVHSIDRRKGSASQGFTLIEMMMVIAILGTLAAISIPMYFSSIEKARIVKTIADIRLMSIQISNFMSEIGRFPNDLSEVGLDRVTDSWGNPFRYVPVEGTPIGSLRKDRFLVPVNSDFDLYSMGKDGKTSTPFTAQSSKDDIIRANDGGYIGLVSDY